MSKGRIEEEGPAIALQLHRAGAVYEYRMGDEDRATVLQAALTTFQTFPPASTPI